MRLRELRAAENLTLRELSRLTMIPISTLSDAFAGRTIPTLQIVMAIARATKADEQELRTLWETARGSAYAARAVRRRARRTEDIKGADLGAPPSDANRVMESAAREAQQRTVVHDLYRLAGRPSVRELADATGLSRSAVHRAVSGQSTAGARKVADGLAARLAPGEREKWTAKITHVYEEAAPGAEETTPPFRALHADERETVAAAFSEFERSLQQVRNLIAHGSVQMPPEIRAQVMILAATMEQARSGRPLDPSGPFRSEVLAEHYRLVMQEQAGNATSAGGATSDRRDNV
jgi:transcriptional regulator with XRE-family HTH domain